LTEPTIDELLQRLEQLLDDLQQIAEILRDSDERERRNGSDD